MMLEATFSGAWAMPLCGPFEGPFGRVWSLAKDLDRCGTLYHLPGCLTCGLKRGSLTVSETFNEEGIEWLNEEICDPLIGRKIRSMEMGMGILGVDTQVGL